MNATPIIGALALIGSTMMATAPDARAEAPGPTIAAAGIANDAARRAPLDGLLSHAEALVATDQAGAIEAFEAIRQRHPRDVSSRQWLAKLLAWNQRPAEIVPVLEELVGIDPSEPLMRELAQHYIWNGRSKDAMPIYERLHRSNPQDEPLLRELIKVYGWNGEAKGLLSGYEELHRLAPNDLEVTGELAKHLTWNERGVEAIPLLEQLTAARPGDVALNRSLGMQLAAAGRGDEARGVLERVLDKEPGDIQSRYVAAQLYHWSPDWTRAEDHYKEILAREPGHLEAQRSLALLDAAHAPTLKARAQMVTDSNDLEKYSVGLRFMAWATSRWQVGGHLDNDHILEPSRDDAGGTDHIMRQSAEIAARVQLAPGFALAARFGGEAFTTGRIAPIWQVGIENQFFGRIFTALRYERKSHLNGHAPIEAEVTFDDFTASVYSEPTPWLIASAAITYGLTSDGNDRTLFFGSVWLVPIKDVFRLKVGSTFGREAFGTSYATALPYYTPDLWVATPTIELGLAFGEVFEVAAGYGLGVDLETGDANHKPHATLRWKIGASDELDARYDSSGAAVYNSQQLTLNYSHAF